MNNIFRTTAFLALLGLDAAQAQQVNPATAPQPIMSTPANEMGRVISSTPVIQQFATPTQVCTNQQVTVQPSKSGAGGIMGAIAGGAIGNAIGAGSGRDLATAIGFIGGALAGNSIEGSPPAQIKNVQTCSMQTTYENRIVGYHVLYEYAGKQYSVQMPQAPGAYIPLQIMPLGTTLPSTPPPAPISYIQPQPQTIYVQPPPVVQLVSAPAPYYYGYPSTSVGFDFNFGHRHWH